MDIPIEKIITSSGLEVYAVQCRVLVNPVVSGRIHVIPELEAVIDTGGPCSEAQGDILRAFDILKDEYGVSVRPSDIRHVFLTHGHIDHIGGLPLFTHPKMISYVHELDFAMVSHVDMFRKQSTAALERFFEQCQIPYANRGDLRKTFSACYAPQKDYSIGRLIQDNEIIGPFKFYHVPGHTRGQVNIQLDNVLFSGDNIMSQTITPPLWPHSFSRYQGCGNYEKGFRRIKRVVEKENIEIILPSHECTIYEPMKRLEAIERAEKRRYKRILDYLKIGNSSMSLEERLCEISSDLLPYTWDIATRFYVTPTLHFLLINLFDVAARLEYMEERSSLLQTV